MSYVKLDDPSSVHLNQLAISDYPLDTFNGICKTISSMKDHEFLEITKINKIYQFSMQQLYCCGWLCKTTSCILIRCKSTTTEYKQIKTIVLALFNGHQQHLPYNVHAHDAITNLKRRWTHDREVQLELEAFLKTIDLASIKPNAHNMERARTSIAQMTIAATKEREVAHQAGLKDAESKTREATERVQAINVHIEKVTTAAQEKAKQIELTAQKEADALIVQANGTVLTKIAEASQQATAKLARAEIARLKMLDENEATKRRAIQETAVIRQKALQPLNKDMLERTQSKLGRKIFENSMKDCEIICNDGSVMAHALVLQTVAYFQVNDNRFSTPKIPPKAAANSAAIEKDAKLSLDSPSKVYDLSATSTHTGFGCEIFNLFLNLIYHDHIQDVSLLQLIELYSLVEFMGEEDLKKDVLASMRRVFNKNSSALFEILPALFESNHLLIPFMLEQFMERSRYLKWKFVPDPLKEKLFMALVQFKKPIDESDKKEKTATAKATDSSVVKTSEPMVAKSTESTSAAASAISVRITHSLIEDYTTPLIATPEQAVITALGRCFWNGIGTQPSPVEALKCYRHSHVKEYAFAQFLLGETLLSGNEKERDSKLGKELIDRACKRGNPLAQNFMGWCHRTEQHGVNKDLAKATKLFKASADQGFAIAQYNVVADAYFFRDETNRVAEGFALIRASAEQGFNHSQNLLAECFYRGSFVTKSYEEAYKITCAAVEQESEHSLDHLGDLNFAALPAIFPENGYIYLPTILFGHGMSLHNQGFLLENGYGVPPDRDAAIAAYKKAAQIGIPNAIAWLERNKIPQE